MNSFAEIEMKRIPFQIMSLAQFRPEKNHKEGKNIFTNIFFSRNLILDGKLAN